MHIVYIDEVKNGPSEPCYWLCGLAIPEADILSLDESLNRLAATYFGSADLLPETEFHASHIFQGKGAFKGHDLTRRIDLLKQLAGLVSEFPDVGRILICIDPSRMKRPDCGHFALMFFIEKVEQLMQAKESTALLIADHDRQYVTRNVLSVSAYRALGTDFQFGMPIRRVVDTIHHTQSSHSRLLQLADTYTYCMAMRRKREGSQLRTALVDHLDSLPHFSFPSKYKYWPPDAA